MWVSYLNLNPGATVAVMAWRLAPHCGRQAELEGAVSHLHHDPQQDQRLLWHGHQSDQAQLVITPKLQKFTNQLLLKFNAPSRYRDTSEWKPFHHDAAAMKVLGKGRFFPKSTVTEQEHYDTSCVPVQTTNGTIQISARQSKNTELYSCSLFWLREVLKSIS